MDCEYVDLHEVWREKERALVSRAHNYLVLLVQQMQADTKRYDAASAIRAGHEGGKVKGLIVLSLAFVFVTVMFLADLNVWAGV